MATMSHSVGELGVDFAWDTPNFDTLKSSGYKFCMNYLSWLPNGKVLTASRRDAMLSRGFAIGPNWEYDSSDQLRGTSGGNTDGAEAYRQAVALGVPEGVTIWFSCDFDVQDSQRSVVQNYWTAAKNQLQGRYQMGVYGGRRAATWALALGHKAWQTYAWSGGVVVPGIHIYQFQNGVTIAGADCDKDKLMRLDAGLWNMGYDPSGDIDIITSMIG